MTDPTQHPWPAGTRRLQVHDVQIDLRYRRVIRPDQEAELPQRMFDLLLVFLAEPQVLHTRAELFARVWPGVIVEDANLSQSVWMLRKALGEARKHWIRTVAKSGYVFEPPAPVQAVVEGPAADVTNKESPQTGTTPAGTAPAEVAPTESTQSEPAHPETARAGPAAPSQQVPPTPPRRRWRVAAAAAVVVVLALGATAWWLRTRDQAAEAAHAEALAIALIDVEDQAAPEDARWPVTLLHAWLGWKLDNLPEVTLLTEAHLAAESEGRSPRIVFLSSGIDPADPNQVFLRARYDAAGREQRLEKKGPRAQLPAMADQLSRELLARLVPARADERWPALAIDTATAKRYAEGVDALERRDWVASSRIFQDVTTRAPGFGLAHFQYGYVLMRLSHAAPSVTETRTAIGLLKPIPADVGAVLQAELLSRDPQQAAEAAKAYGALAARHPEKSVFALDQANMLLNAAKPEEAIPLLNQPHWSRKSVGTQLRQRLNLSSAYLALGDAVQARKHALAAEQIARQAGAGWEQESGEALLLVAHADNYQYEEKSDPARYLQAAKQFEIAGDDMAALYARFLAESNQPAHASEADLDTLLLQARERGYRRLEIDMLRLDAFRHYSLGELTTYRARLEQALAIALATGDTFEQHVLELYLLNEDFMRGHYEDAERRLASLRKAGLQGDGAIVVAQFDAILTANRGDFQGAEAVLLAAEARDRKVNPAKEQSTASSRIACMRADLSLAGGNIDNARALWKACDLLQQPSTRLQAQIGNASVDVLAGDRSSGLKSLRDALTQVEKQEDGPDRWLNELWLATQLTRAGDAATAERLNQRVLPMAVRTGYEWIRAMAETGLAENAAIRGDWQDVEQRLRIARQLRGASLWTVRYRLAVVSAVAAMQRGDGKGALDLITTTYAEAQRHGDVVAQMELQSLVPAGMTVGECNERCRTGTVARTGLRGATLDWLVVPAKVDRQVLARNGVR
ncbi:winged helix-turn-helix domain-containing protein [Lysobacter solisilvae (ex Woo and Kim 2022)]|uniref:Winged helix-turn-helix domain-containing protein n=1 Tax=Agrilutibacter terrestris TaxID=2865112 RepID=A0A7H0FV12_9GAMM|nr:winged helix-turn-helix domain-containing protein [Lysobacter terrestris]QNP39878.1 winged helix-turn-helix domain-containing protein [Lysobacter terrestris]